MYSIKKFGKTFDVHPMDEVIHTYCIYESSPSHLTKEFIELLANGNTEIIRTYTYDLPEITHFESHTIIRNISSTIWVFKELDTSHKNLLILSNLSKDVLEYEFDSFFESLNSQEKEIFFARIE